MFSLLLASINIHYNVSLSEREVILLQPGKCLPLAHPSLEIVE
jgi:hypothetical protein